ncbi:MAG: sulfite exporter TauE/SafE family protein [Parabacteroides sp.]|nr:sulfite exporter TauE/SafE family protein [Parabacteroides sp.]
MSMYIILIIVGFIAGFFSGSVGFGGGMILLPVITYFYGVTIAVPVSTIAQLLSNLSRAGFGFKDIHWKEVGLFLILAAPLTALGAYGFVIVPKQLMTRILCFFLIFFSIMKLVGRMELPRSKSTVLIGGGITGLTNGLLGISGPISSAVFMTFGLSPVAYIASEATAASVMHIIKTFMYGKMNLMDEHIFLNGVFIGIAMMAGNFFALKFIRHVNKKRYQKVVAGVMILVSLWLMVTI